jgi:hypothetical protein
MNKTKIQAFRYNRNHELKQQNNNKNKPFNTFTTTQSKKWNHTKQIDNGGYKKWIENTVHYCLE